MNILYKRVSKLTQHNNKQLLNKEYYDLIIEDKCLGTIPFFEREGGKKILKLLNDNQITSLNIPTMDRIAREGIDALNTIKYFNKKGVYINFIQ